ncbi:hypothetical protein [Cellulosimicrobium sp. TH-20]|uniref:hypothetical protein n=1 Tax=Cellulosimicrobium sp. TH-20 TaxID=1980001 RepID=UPI0015831AFD
MSTPALARATEALFERYESGAAEVSVPVAKVDDFAPDARAAVSAALHDPDDPDWLARCLAEREWALLGVGRSWEAVAPFEREMYRDRADAVRAAILGEA